MSSDIVISAAGLAKRYELYDRPSDRLKQMLWRGQRKFFREFWAIRGIDLEVRQGEVLGIVGRNGAGKSTLLQLICGTLAPTSGTLRVSGRIAPLLELGAGFNPDFSGRENIYLNASILGMSAAEIDACCEEIIDFSGIRDFIDQPVKTYSSGMYVRLAFSIAISVDPDILVVDEALSVGDGEFARKSFDRIIALKDAGKTILFCSHSTYQVDVLCQRALWLEHGQARMLDSAARVTAAYNTALAVESGTAAGAAGTSGEAAAKLADTAMAPPSSGRIVAVHGQCGDSSGTHLQAKSLASTLAVTVDFMIDPSLPRPSVAFGIENAAGITVSSVFSIGHEDAVVVDARGRGHATVVFPRLPLMKGEYRFSAFLVCELGLHPYDLATQCLTLEVSQDGAAQGIVELPHEWRSGV